MLTQSKLKKYVSYNPDTGVFTWKKIPPKTSSTKVGNEAGCDNGHGYLVFMIEGVMYRAHRLAFLYMKGKMPKKYVDHINGKKSDNRWCNLREVDENQNAKNSRLQKNNKSGVSGVHWNSSRLKWKSIIWNKNKSIYLGEFEDFFDAACVRKSAELTYNYHRNHGRTS